jgi:glycosyltransferase involved in cell wall biosynthesis
MNPKVSVIILIYQTENYIERCAKSLFEQTLEDIEYIFVNDCTKDRSVEVLKGVVDKYPSRKPFVNIFSLEKNMGQAYARKYGIKQATGKYIIHCDSDDWIAPNMYSEMYLLAEQNKYDVVKCDFYRENIKGFRVSKQFDSDFFENKYNVISKLLVGTELSSMVDKLVRAKVVKDSRIIAPTYNMQEDLVYCLQYFLYSDKIGYIKKPYYYYCLNRQSISHKLNVDSYLSRLRDVCQNTKLAEIILKNNNLANEMRDEIDCLKYNDRCHIQDLIGDSEYYAMWSKVFPEIDKRMITNRKMRYKVKIHYILSKLGLYSFYLRMKK